MRDFVPLQRRGIRNYDNTAVQIQVSNKTIIYQFLTGGRCE